MFFRFLCIQEKGDVMKRRENAVNRRKDKHT